MRALLLLFLVFVGCSPTLRDGYYACSGAGVGDCPPGYLCVAGRCRTGRGTECRYDYECEQPCTDDACDNGFCSHEPSTAEDGQYCDDDQVCNGTGTCMAGACIQDGIAPCDPCDVTTGCSTCGQVTQACCAGDICFEGQCNGGTCESCGGAQGDPCCFDGSCSSGLTCDMQSSTCQPCGTVDQLCCFDRFGVPLGGEPVEQCEAPLTCVPSFDGQLRCVGCGNEGEPCCADGCRVGICDPSDGLCHDHCGGTTCGVGAVCDEMGGCSICGGPMGYCCSDGSTSPCEAGLSCFYGICDGTAVSPG